MDLCSSTLQSLNPYTGALGKVGVLAVGTNWELAKTSNCCTVPVANVRRSALQGSRLALHTKSPASPHSICSVAVGRLGASTSALGRSHRTAPLVAAPAGSERRRTRHGRLDQHQAVRRQNDCHGRVLAYDGVGAGANFARHPATSPGIRACTCSRRLP